MSNELESKIKATIKQILHSCFTESVNCGYRDKDGTKFAELRFNLKYDLAAEAIMRVIKNALMVKTAEEK